MDLTPGGYSTKLQNMLIHRCISTGKKCQVVSLEDEEILCITERGDPEEMANKTFPGWYSLYSQWCIILSSLIE